MQYIFLLWSLTCGTWKQALTRLIPDENERQQALLSELEDENHEKLDLEHVTVFVWSALGSSWFQNLTQLQLCDVRLEPSSSKTNWSLLPRTLTLLEIQKVKGFVGDVDWFALPRQLERLFL